MLIRACTIVIDFAEHHDELTHTDLHNLFGIASFENDTRRKRIISRPIIPRNMQSESLAAQVISLGRVLNPPREGRRPKVSKLAPAEILQAVQKPKASTSDGDVQGQMRKLAQKAAAIGGSSVSSGGDSTHSSGALESQGSRTDPDTSFGSPHGSPHKRLRLPGLAPNPAGRRPIAPLSKVSMSSFSQDMKALQLDTNLPTQHLHSQYVTHQHPTNTEMMYPQPILQDRGGASLRPMYPQPISSRSPSFRQNDQFREFVPGIPWKGGAPAVQSMPPRRTGRPPTGADIDAAVRECIDRDIAAGRIRHPAEINADHVQPVSITNTHAFRFPNSNICGDFYHEESQMRQVHSVNLNTGSFYSGNHLVGDCHNISAFQYGNDTASDFNFQYEVQPNTSPNDHGDIASQDGRSSPQALQSCPGTPPPNPVFALETFVPSLALLGIPHSDLPTRIRLAYEQGYILNPQYDGELSVSNNSNADCPPHLNCAIRIENISPHASLSEIFATIREGKVFSFSKKPPIENVYPNCAARLVFTTRASAEAFWARGNSPAGIVLRGVRWIVKWNRDKCRPVRANESHQSRVLRITGPIDFCHAQDIENVFHTQIKFHLVEKKEWKLDDERKVAELSFPSILGQSRIAYRFFHEYMESKGLVGTWSVAFAADPCERAGEGVVQLPTTMQQPPNREFAFLHGMRPEQNRCYGKQTRQIFELPDNVVGDPAQPAMDHCQSHRFQQGYSQLQGRAKNNVRMDPQGHQNLAQAGQYPQSQLTGQVMEEDEDDDDFPPLGFYPSQRHSRDRH